MVVGLPKEIKNRENRVGLIPAGVRTLTQGGHKVLVQKGAGVGSGITDEMFSRAGATLVATAEDAWSGDMVVKVKEPLEPEFKFLRAGLTLFTYLHLAAEKKLTEILLEQKVTGIAYETIQEADGGLPLLRPMSEVAGRMSAQVGAFYLQSSWDKENSGKGVLLGGVPGVMPGKVVVLGGGVAGTNAAKVALGMGALVTVLDVNPHRLEYLEHIFDGRILTLMSNLDTIEESVAHADLVIGAVLIPGARAPKLVSRKMVSQMAPGSVLVDVAVDQGGCTETCRPTSHENPTFLVDGVVHYCVTNMPGAVSRTSTYALTNATLRFALQIADKGPEKAAQINMALKRGFNTYRGQLVHHEVAESHGLRFTELSL
ncbi:MAG: alanine dehydrogenase [Deltaproteobacteria bacterium]|nr:alanine dehydrogenase [Deltaproteobacteria bacterium]MBI3294624.1 alanine dehydrogenase [Deltaproteobacteria bacterium]